MERSLFEQMGGTYHQEDGYLLPDLVPLESIPIGIWGQRRRRFAYVPSWYCQLDDLVKLARPEPWRFREPIYSTKNPDTPILERYIHAMTLFFHLANFCSI